MSQRGSRPFEQGHALGQGGEPPNGTVDGDDTPWRPIGEILRQSHELTETQIKRITGHQAERGLRFGEAAVALRFVTDDDVMWALSQQFHYPYAASPKVRFGERVLADNPFGEQAEAFRELRAQLLMGVLMPGKSRRALAVVSPDIGDGKTFIAANLAMAFSQLGANTLLIDADMRTPRQHRLFEMPLQNGLSNILLGRAESNAIRPVEDLPNLFVLPVGSVPPNPLELVQRPAFGLLVRELLGKFEHVVVDTPADCHGADARVIAAHCGAVLAVGRRGTSRLQSMERLVSMLSQGPAQMAGLVMNER